MADDDDAGRRVRQRRGAPERASRSVDTSAAHATPLLVCVLAGNPATSAAILACLNSVEASRLRRLHPAVEDVVAGVPWADMGTPVADVVRWRAAFPAACGARMTQLPVGGSLAAAAAAALAGVVSLDLHECTNVTDATLSHLPTSLRALNVSQCTSLTPAASFAHLSGLTSLTCARTRVAEAGVGSLPPSLLELTLDRCVHPPTADFRHLAALRVLSVTWVDLTAAAVASLPPSLQVLDLSNERSWPTDASLAHLPLLRVLRAAGSALGDVALASLPAGVVELDVAHCGALSPAAPFAHLPALHTLVAGSCSLGDASLASLPPSLGLLDISNCHNLTPAAALPHLPALRLLDVSLTDIGDAAVASMPAGLTELRMVSCDHVTADATLDHLRALHTLQCCGTSLAPAGLAACRDRGCAMPTVRVLCGHQGIVSSLALLPDGRLASGDATGEVRLWNVAADTREGEETTAVFRADGEDVYAMAALPDGRRLAISTDRRRSLGGRIEVWTVDQHVPPVRQAAFDTDRMVWALVAQQHGSCVAAGCNDGVLRFVDVNAGTVMAVLLGHTGGVTALAALPGRDGLLASASWDGTVRVWDTVAQVRLATLIGHTEGVTALAVLPDGTLASASTDNTVRLWDVGSRACIRVLPWDASAVALIAALPDGRLAAVKNDLWSAAVWLWDVRPGAAAARIPNVGVAVPGAVLNRRCGRIATLLPLPDGRLATAHAGGRVRLLTLPPAPPLPP